MKCPFEIEIVGKKIIGILNYNEEVLIKQDTLICIIFCYGFNGDRVDQHRILYKFSVYCSNNSKFLCIRFDYRNHGLSDGEFMYANFKEKCEDVINVVKWVKKSFENKKINIVLLGFSDGAKVVMEVYLRNKELINKIILWNPVLSISRDHNVGRNHKKMQDKNKIVLHPYTRKPVIKFLGLWVNPSLMRDIQNDNYLCDLAACTLPLAIIWGEEDYKTIDIKNALNNFELSSTIIQKNISGADHLFSSKEFEDELFLLTQELIGDN